MCIRDSCDSPSLKVNKLFKHTFIFYKNNCVIENDSQKKVKLANEHSNYNKSEIENLKPVHDYANVTYKPKKDYKWVKNKWLWIGLGAIATTIIVSSNQNKGSKTSQPKRGF